MTKIGEPDHIGVVEPEPVFIPEPIREPDPVEVPVKDPDLVPVGIKIERIEKDYYPIKVTVSGELPVWPGMGSVRQYSNFLLVHDPHPFRLIRGCW